MRQVGLLLRVRFHLRLCENSFVIYADENRLKQEFPFAKSNQAALRTIIKSGRKFLHSLTSEQPRSRNLKARDITGGNI
jgi:hypothetical protein